MFDKECQLFETAGKGGWTFVEITDIPMQKTPFGMMKVKGTIDDYEFSDAHLMPVGNGHLGLPVRAEIRKRIKKSAPDTVRIILYEDKAPLIIPEELILCMKDEDGLWEKFERYTPGQKRLFVNWINSAKTERTRIDRIAKTITKVQNGEKLYQE